MWISANTNQKIKKKKVLMIQYNLESGQRDLSNGNIGFRVQDLEIEFGLGFRIWN